MRIVRSWMALALGLSVTQAHAANSPEDLALQWCANCHGVDGNSISPLFPRLAGQQTTYLVQQLQAFRARNRSDQAAHDYMWGVAGTLDDAAIKGVAAYFSAQRPLPNPAAVDSAEVSAGRLLYLNGSPATSTPACAVCHGSKAEGNENAPRLAGQHAAYVIKQLHVFQTSQRPSAMAMQGIVKTLSEADIHALAAYLQTR
ncbi:cytochrome c4 [Neisseriaceae bacterium JH1-16]|nr:cytochrome c4 [Neisseriaceae bacterium JH1-16]